MIKALFALALVGSIGSIGCSGEAYDEQPAGELEQPASTGPQRACGCADLTVFSVPPGKCLAVAYRLWSSVEDDIACFDLTPDDATCTRTCAGYLEIKNTTGAPIKVSAHSKLASTGPSAPRIMSPNKADADYNAQCAVMFGQTVTPTEQSMYAGTDAFIGGIRYSGGPKATTFPAPGPSVCP